MTNNYEVLRKLGPESRSLPYTEVTNLTTAPAQIDSFGAAPPLENNMQFNRSDIITIVGGICIVAAVCITIYHLREREYEKQYTFTA